MSYPKVKSRGNKADLYTKTNILAEDYFGANSEFNILEWDISDSEEAKHSNVQDPYVNFAIYRLSQLKKDCLGKAIDTYNHTAATKVSIKKEARALAQDEDFLTLWCGLAKLEVRAVSEWLLDDTRQSITFDSSSMSRLTDKRSIEQRLAKQRSRLRQREVYCEQ